MTPEQREDLRVTAQMRVDRLRALRELLWGARPLPYWIRQEIAAVLTQLIEEVTCEKN